MIQLGPAVGVVVVLYALAGAAVAWLGRTGYQLAVPWATVRAALQLVVLALVIGYVAHRPWLAGAFVLLMSAVAAHAAATRVLGAPKEAGGGRRPTVREVLWCAVPVAVPSLAVVAALLAVGIVRPNGLSVIPVAGIYLGNSMAVTGLAGRRAHDELRTRHGEVEAALSLGLTVLESRLLVCREAAASALGPSVDQTRTIGLVTIPGAFVGMVLGGAQPWEAGVMQLFVSAGILALGAVALVITTLLVAAERI